MGINALLAGLARRARESQCKPIRVVREPRPRRKCKRGPPVVRTGQAGEEHEARIKAHTLRVQTELARLAGRSPCR